MPDGGGKRQNLPSKALSSTWLPTFLESTCSLPPRSRLRLALVEPHLSSSSESCATKTTVMANDESCRVVRFLRDWTPGPTPCHRLTLAEPSLLPLELLNPAFSLVSRCALHLPGPSTTALGSLWMRLRSVFRMLASHGSLPYIQAPNPSNGDSGYHLLKDRSALTPSGSTLSQHRWCLLKAFVRRLQIASNTPLLLWLYKKPLRTLPLASPRIMNHEFISFTLKGCLCPTLMLMRTLPTETSRIFTHVVKGLKSSGIMIMSLKSGDYRNFFSPYITYPVPDPTYVHINLFLNMPYTLKSLEPKLHPSFFNQTLSVLFKTKSTKPTLHFLWSYWLHALCGFLNILGQGPQVRENPPVLLQFDFYHWHMALVFFGRSVCVGLKSYGLSPCNPIYPLDDFKTIYFSTSPISRTLWIEDNPRSNGSYLLTWALHPPTLSRKTMVPRISAIALLVYLVLASDLALDPPTTSKCRLTLTTLSSIVFFDDDLSSICDLICSYLLHSICFITFMVFTSMSFIFLFMVLENTYSCNSLNFGIFESPVCTLIWFE